MVVAGNRTVGGHRNLPAGGQQTLPTHGHLLTQGAGGGAHDSPAGAALDRHFGHTSSDVTARRYGTLVLRRAPVSLIVPAARRATRTVDMARRQSPHVPWVPA
jgi:hypothetical protein